MEFCTGKCVRLKQIHSQKLTWNPKMEVWMMIFLFKYATFRFHRLVFWNSTRIQFWFLLSPPAVQETASRVPFSTCRLSKTSKRPQGSKAGPAMSENSKTWKNVRNYPKGCNFQAKMKVEFFFLTFNSTGISVAFFRILQPPDHLLWFSYSSVAFKAMEINGDHFHFWHLCIRMHK